MNGIIKTGVSVTASCLSEKRVPRMREYPPLALYIKNRIRTERKNNVRISKMIRLTEVWELVPIICVKPDEMVAAGSKYNWDKCACRELRKNLCPEVSTPRIHIVVCFTQEYWSLVGEDKDDALN